METQQVAKNNLAAIKEFFNGKGTQEKFKELLGNKAPGFITSVLQVVNNNKQLVNADPASVYGAAAAAAILDLPINNNLGFAYIVPYKEKQPDGTYKEVAQFQMGYKGFIQLGQRSGLINRMAATPIYEGQIVSENPLTGYEFDFTVKSDKVVGYASYFRLNNGFESIYYMPLAEIDKHAKRYSQTFKKGFGLWKDDFEKMACKTVLKLNLSKYAPLSIEMQKALMFDQARINNPETDDVVYPDGVDAEAVEVIELDDLKQMLGSKMDVLTPEELTHAERIISNNETSSFNKLHAFLKTK